MSIPIIDSHIHLFPAAHLETLAWHALSNPLGTQHSVCEYRQASSSALHTDNDSTYLKGFVFLETDRISSLAPQSWNHALDEVSFLARIAAGTPLPGEGHEPADRELCLAIVPWAPVPAGPQSLLEYLTLVRERTQTDEIWKKVTGVRYLVQDKPAGTMLGDRFVESLRWLGREGFSFDLGVDARQGGLWQLEEAIEMFQKVFTNEHGEVDLNAGPKIVINHMCKPNLRIETGLELVHHPEYISWCEQIERLARFPTAYMKLSGLFSELPPLPLFTSEAEETALIVSLAHKIRPWTDAIFQRFGPSRIMFGSDWPVCNIGGGGNTLAWVRWKRVVEMVLEERAVTESERRDVWGRVAGKVYRCFPDS